MISDLLLPLQSQTSIVLDLITGLQIQTWPNQLGNLLLVADIPILGGRFGYFYFFCSGEGKGEPEAPGGGGDFLWKIPGAGVSRVGGGGGARGREGVCGEFGGGGGAKYFFFGATVF